MFFSWWWNPSHSNVFTETLLAMSRLNNSICAVARFFVDILVFHSVMRNNNFTSLSITQKDLVFSIAFYLCLLLSRNGLIILFWVLLSCGRRIMSFSPTVAFSCRHDFHGSQEKRKTARFLFPHPLGFRSCSAGQRVRSRGNIPCCNLPVSCYQVTSP